MSLFYGQQKPPSAAVPPPRYPARQPSSPENNIFKAGMNWLIGPSSDPMRESVRLQNDPPPTEKTCAYKYCSWATLNYYRPYFNVTTAQVKDRMGQSLKFWQPEFFTTGGSYDLYGPFWIYSTLAFCLGAVPNIVAYQNSTYFSYNFEFVAFALGLIYTEGFGFAAFLVSLMRCMGGSAYELPYSSMMSLYGYSHTISIIAIMLCCINVPLLHYIVLGYALASRLLFIIRNVGRLNVSLSKKTIVSGLIIAYAVFMFLVFKFYFLRTPDVKKLSHLSVFKKQYF